MNSRILHGQICQQACTHSTGKIERRRQQRVFTLFSKYVHDMTHFVRLALGAVIIIYGELLEVAGAEAAASATAANGAVGGRCQGQRVGALVSGNIFMKIAYPIPAHARESANKRTPMHSLFLSPARALSLSPSLTLSFALSFSLSLCLCECLSLPLSLSLSLSLSVSVSLVLPLPPSLLFFSLKLLPLTLPFSTSSPLCLSASLSLSVILPLALPASPSLPLSLPSSLPRSLSLALASAPPTPLSPSLPLPHTHALKKCTHTHHDTYISCRCCLSSKKENQTNQTCKRENRFWPCREGDRKWGGGGFGSGEGRGRWWKK